MKHIKIKNFGKSGGEAVMFVSSRIGTWLVVMRIMWAVGFVYGKKYTISSEVDKNDSDTTIVYLTHSGTVYKALSITVEDAVSNDGMALAA